MSRWFYIRISTLMVLIFLSVDVWARIKLITLPVRERVEIQLSNTAVTRVEEERIVPLVAGANQVDFSWGNTSIDPASILFRLVAGKEKMTARVLSVSYPPNENSLVWNLWADQAGAARVRIGYLIGGLTKTYHYRAIADHDEQKLVLRQFLRLKNQSNESFDRAVLKVADGQTLTRAVGLAETKDLLLNEFTEVVIRKRFTADLAEYGYQDAVQKKLKVSMHYVLQNDTIHGLGQAALPFGKVRIFLQDGKGGSAFVGEDWGDFTPRDDELVLYLGVARDIVVKRTIERNNAQRINGNLYNYDLIVKYEIENFKDKPVVLDIVEDVRRIRRDLGRNNGRDIEWELGKQTSFTGGLDVERSGLEKLVFHVSLPARKGEGKVVKQIHKLHLKIKNEW